MITQCEFLRIRLFGGRQEGGGGETSEGNVYVTAFCPILPSPLRILRPRPLPSCSEPHYESEAKCEVFKTNFHMNSFALSLAFIMRLTGTRKWTI